jgi:hypothetical protein
MNMKKVHVLVIVVLVVLGLGAYSFFINNEEISQEPLVENSIVYRNEKFGYQISLPDNYVALSEYDGSAYPLDPQSEFMILGPKPGDAEMFPHLEIHVIEKREDSDTRAFIEYARLGGTKVASGEAEINGQRAEIYQIGSTSRIAYLFEIDESFYLFTVDEKDVTGKKIVESFRLVE